MTEILTESFCERCGTRYTFESARPKLRLKGVKVVSRGLKNFVLSDGTSMDEAMAAARSETEREVTTYQLDAFHKTFNFCMQCRQYTCPNCWNEAEARCLTCAPTAGDDILPTPFPDLPAALTPPDDPTGGGAILVTGVNGVRASDATQVEQADADFDVMARLDALTFVAEPAWDVAMPVAAAPEPAFAIADVEAEPEVVAEAVPEVVAEAEPEVVAEAEPAVAEAEPAVAEAEPAVAAEDHDAATIAALAAAAALIADPTDAETRPAARPEGKSRGLFSRFKPGQNLDEELEAYEREQAAAVAAAAISADAPPVEAAVEPDTIAEAAVEPEVVETSAVVEFQPEPEVAVEPEIAAAPDVDARAGVALAAEPEMTEAPEVAAIESIVEAAPEAVAEPESKVAEAAIIGDDAVEVEAEVRAEPEPEPIAAAAATEPEAVPVANDVIAQPTWQTVAPAAPAAESVVPETPGLPAAATAAEPQWPTRPAWLGNSPSVGLPFLGRSTTPEGGLDALWAESNREVASPPSATKPAGVQPCVNCGLSLSATARFCRRCGTPQAI